MARLWPWQAVKHQVVSRVLSLFGTSAMSLDPDVDLERIGREGYKKSQVMRACIDEIASSAAEPRLVVEEVAGDGSAEEVDRAHPLARLMARPNRLQSQFEWIEQLVIDFETFGNQYTHKVRSLNGGVVEMFNLRPWRTEIVPSRDGMVLLYKFKRSAEETLDLDPDDVAHLRVVDPMDDFLGLPPIGSALRSLDLDREAEKYLLAFFLNAGTPHGILSLKARVEGSERQRIKDLWQIEHGGEGGWHSLSVLDADAEYKEIGTRPDKLKLDSIFDLSESRVCAAFHVPPIIVQVRLGLMRSTFSNYKEARRSFWAETLVPLYERVGDKLTMEVASEFGEDLRVRFDLSNIEELQESLDSRRDFAIKSWDGGLMTRNEARDIVDLEPVTGGDSFKTKTSDADPFQANKIVPPETAGGKAGPPADGIADPLAVSADGGFIIPEEFRADVLRLLDLDKDAKFADKAASDPEWKQLHRIADERVGAFGKVFTDNRRLSVTPEVRKAVEDAFRRGRLDEVERALNLGESETRMLASYRTAFEETAEAAGRAAARFLPEQVREALSFDMLNPLASKYAATESGTLVTGVNNKSLTAIRRVMHEAFDSGLPPAAQARQLTEIVGMTDAQAKSVQNFRQRLVDAGDAADKVDKATERFARKVIRRRATNIARTETIRAASEGQRMIWKEATDQGLLDKDKVQREWIVTPDDRLDTEMCLPMAGQRRGLDEPFATGTGSQVMAPPVHPGCRCAQGLVLKETP